MSKYAHMLPERSHTVPSKRRREVRPVSDQALPLLAPGAILQRAALESLRPVEVVRMQQTLGNRAVGELLGRSSSSSPRIQAKLTINAPGDEYEREADRVAEQMMHVPPAERAELEDEDEEPEVMTKREPAHGVSGAFEAGEEFEQQLNVTRGQGQPLPPTLKQEFETRFGADFSRVRIHADVRSAEMNRAIQARAFTHAQDIYLGAGQYGPDSTAGKRLLAHELTHVVQQSMNNCTPSMSREVSPEPDGKGVVQAKFGFEVETNIGLRQIAQARFKNANSDPGVAAPTKEAFISVHPQANAEFAVATGWAGFEIKIDHHIRMGVTDPRLKPQDWTLEANPNLLSAPTPQQVSEALEYDEPEDRTQRGPIAEFVVYPPLDEFTTTEKTVKDTLTKMGRIALDLKSAALREPLEHFYTGGVTEAGVRVGVKGAKPNIADGKMQIQTTAGIQLSRVEQYLSEMSRPARTITDPGAGKIWEPPEQGEEEVSNFVEQLAVQNGKQALADMGFDPTVYPIETGKFILISQYLVATHYSGKLGRFLAKNKVGSFFYKTKLSKFFDPARDPDLADAVPDITDALLKANRVDPATRILNIFAGRDDVAPHFSAEDWLKEVLLGQDDKVFEWFRNPYSKAIGPENIGTPGPEGLAVIMEKRKGEPPLPKGENWSSAEMETKAEAWGTLGALVYRYLCGLHGIEPK
jgi:hypothetical protein